MSRFLYISISLSFLHWRRCIFVHSVLFLHFFLTKYRTKEIYKIQITQHIILSLFIFLILKNRTKNTSQTQKIFRERHIYTVRLIALSRRRLSFVYDPGFKEERRQNRNGSITGLFSLFSLAFT